MVKVTELNSLKTIFSRMTTMNGSIDALNSVGVAVHDMEGDVRPVSNILDDLGGKWSDLNAEQQQSIGLQIAGRFQLSRFLVLMQNHSRAIEATGTALNSAGSGARENEEYLKSLEARINKLKNAWTEFAINAGDALLSDSIVAFSESLASIVKGSADVVKFIGFLPPVIGAVTIATIAMNTKMRESVVSMGLAASSSRTLTGSLAILRTGALATGTAFVTMRNFMIGAFPPLAIITGITFAFEKLFSAIMKNNAKQKEFQNDLNKSTTSFSAQSDTINDLVNRYGELETARNKNELNTEEEEEYTRIQNELAELLPTVATGIDEKGNSIVVSSEKLSREIELLERKLELERESFLLTAPDKISEVKDDNSDLQKQKQGLEVALNTLEAQREARLLEIEQTDSRSKRIAAEKNLELIEERIRKNRSEQITLDKQILDNTSELVDKP
jgi:hypothetical protein